VDTHETEGERQARQQFARWLEDWLPADYEPRFDAYRRDLDFRADYQRAAFEAGWLVPQWEPRLGGRHLGLVETIAVKIEGAERAAPRIPCVQAVGVVAPALRAHGTPEQQERFLVPALRGDTWWALGMSEPGAGSDLAGLRTRARSDGDDFVVDGQKTWTTQADESRWCLCFCRTDPDVAKHRGITCLVIDLHAPGVDVRPIPPAWNEADRFCEVFFDGVRVPREHMVGERDRGWDVAMTALNHEREMIWVLNWIDIRRALDRIRAASREGPPLAVVEIGRLLTRVHALRYTAYRGVANSSRGAAAPELMLLKLVGSETLQAAWDLATVAAGPEGAVDRELIIEDFDALGATIYGGTSEIQRNLIAERVLGLPR
jgi:alkylation response protein AidB-like acyl-CoA dehydrogenase